MLETFFYGLALGYGAAVPIGAVNLEITRRNLQYGTPHGVSLGLGACSADLVYLLSLSFGMLIVLQQDTILRLVSFLGSLVLLWFAYQSLNMSSVKNEHKSIHQKNMLRNGIDGFLMTLLNPYTILFWLSISSQLASRSDDQNSLWVMSSGLIIATVSWVILLNSVLHTTRHKFTTKTIKSINLIGAIILSIIALLGIYRAIQGFG
ncbi:MAG: LysE family translocator [Pseudomonadota bacterium]